MAQPPKPDQNVAALGTASAEVAAEVGLVEATPSRNDPGSDAGGLVINAAISRIPIEVDVSVPVRNFRVRNLLALEAGHVIESLWHQGEDLPLAAPRAQLAWSEFEVIDRKLAVRITRLL